MKKATWAVAVLLCFGLAGLAGSAAQKNAATAKTPSTTKAASSKSKKSKARGRLARSRSAPSQRSPDESRVREIQQALASRGYDVDVTGTWGQQSVEAVKKFQESQNINNLTGRGKLDSLTLIALGLGPSRPPAATGVPAAEPAADPKQQ